MDNLACTVTEGAWRPTNSGRRHPRFPFAAAALLVVVGCAPTVTITLLQTPAGTRCVFFTVGSNHTDRLEDDVPAGGTASATVGGLPSGVAYFSAEVFQVPCGMVTESTPVTFQGGPMRVVLPPNPDLTVVIDVTAAEDIARSVRFGDPVLQCRAASAACMSDEDCCSKNCPTDAADVLNGKPGTCQSNEPPGLLGKPLSYSPQRLTLMHPGAGVSFPAFDGDWVFVSFPRRPGDGVLTDQQVFDTFVTPALQATGLDEARARIAVSRRDGVLRPLLAGSYTGLVDSACKAFAPLQIPMELVPATGAERAGDEMSQEVCTLLTAGQSPQPWVLPHLTNALGTSLTRLRAEADRALSYWMFPQRVRDVPIEHKGLLALSHTAGTRVSAVFGAALNNFQELNDVALGPNEAVRRGREALLAHVGLPTSEAKLVRQKEPRLVLLPYGVAARTGRTGLRFAYRAFVAANRIRNQFEDVVSYTMWVDAQTGQLLKQVRDGGDQGIVPPPPPPSFDPLPWCRDPSRNANSVAPRCSMPFAVPVPVSGGVVQVSGGGFSVVDQSTLAPLIVQTGAMNNQAQNACQTPDFRAASARGHLSRALNLAKHGGGLDDFTGAIQIRLDTGGNENSANADSSTITLTKGLFGGTCSIPNEVRSGAEDATIVTHELAHITTVQLQSHDFCVADDCASRSPNNRFFFHDYADGLAAMWTQSPCIGGWAAGNTLTTPGGSREKVTEACAKATEAVTLPRMLFADPRPGAASPDPTLAPAASAFVHSGSFGNPANVLLDRFPDHRRTGSGGGRGEYSDGQIVGAAFWHLWQGMYSSVNSATNPILWGRINRGIWSAGFAPTACPGSLICDINIYRAGRELLIQLGDEWKEDDAGQASMNKLLSAFARAGIFAVSPLCLDPLDLPKELNDPLLCPTGTNAGDAIVTIDDGDSSATDGSTFNGVFLADDDFVSSMSTIAPRFRVWTGPPFVFNADGSTDTSATSLRCNGRFKVHYSAGSYHNETDWIEKLPDGPCYYETDMPGNHWTDLQTEFQKLRKEQTSRQLPFTPMPVEYWVETTEGVADDAAVDPCDPKAATSSKRSSLCPGGGVWAFDGKIKPNVFFINSNGSHRSF